MLDINFIRENQDLVRDSISRRHISLDLDQLLLLGKKRRDLIQKVEQARFHLNLFSKVAQIKLAGKDDSEETRFQKAKKEMGQAKIFSQPWEDIFAQLNSWEAVKKHAARIKLSQQLEEWEKELEKVQTEYDEMLLAVPNLLHPDVPYGKDDSENVARKKCGSIPRFNFKIKDHLELGEEKDLIDFERGTKLAGSKFYYLKGEGALLELALTNYVFDLLVKEGFVPLITPEVAQDSIMQGAGFNPRGPEQQIYTIPSEGLSLIATAEITVLGYRAEEVIPQEKLPLKYVALSSCYRREAGSYGRYSRGLYRVHWFRKIEMFLFTLPERSEEMHEYLLGLEEKIWSDLGIPYQVMDICGGDMGAVAYRKYDLEGWMPGRDGGGYGEITSCSNCTDYQARRVNIRYEKENGDLDYVHTLNGTAIAISRALITILENYQQADGSIAIPEVLRPYMHGKKKIR